MAEMAQYHSATMVKQYQPSCARLQCSSSGLRGRVLQQCSSRSKRGCCFELNVSHEKGRRRANTRGPLQPRSFIANFAGLIMLQQCKNRNFPTHNLANNSKSQLQCQNDFFLFSKAGGRHQTSLGKNGNFPSYNNLFYLYE